MGPSKAQNGENMPRKGSSFDDYDRTETLPSDSQIPTSQISGNDYLIVYFCFCVKTVLILSYFFYI